MKLKLSITIIPRGRRRTLSTGTFRVDSRSLVEEPSKLDSPPDGDETTKTAIEQIRSLPAEWTRDFIRSI